VKHIKKSRATHSSDVLEIIHTDICGPFNVKSVDDFNFLLLPSRMISLAMDIFILYGSRRLKSLKYLRPKLKISIMLKLK
jgi:hypothetical protein